ncbi:BPSS1187 family protein [Methylobacterium sp. HMF5984]|uniref:BPSS1187 family protein n=1 Tax=Methylobacterium sp. HMF5984 TaxID=3367370 RepID=UPI003851C6A9
MRFTPIMMVLYILIALMPSHVHAKIDAERVRPSDADKGVGDFYFENIVFNGKDDTRNAPLVVFLPGTGGGRDGGPELLMETVAKQGYRVIFLPYDDVPAVAQACPQRPPQCSARFRAARVFGGEGPVSNPPSEGIVTRLVALLRYLDHEHPNAGWGGFLAPDGGPAWPRIVMSGLSQGAGMAAFIAKRFPVRRVVLFSSPWDTFGPEQLPAPWLAGRSATPPWRWWAERHARENTTRLLAQAYRVLGIPPGHLFLFDGDLPASAYGENPYHGSTVTSAEYVPQWRAMFGIAGSEPSSTETPPRPWRPTRLRP